MSTSLKSIFEDSRKAILGESLEQARQNYYIEAQMRESEATSIGGVNINASGHHDNIALDKKKKDQATQDMIFNAMIRQLQNELAEIERRMAKQHEELRKKYGNDVVGGMAATYLHEQDTTGLHTEQQKMNALADKFLREDGEIKDEYQHLVDAQYTRDWQRSQEIEQELKNRSGDFDISHTEYSLSDSRHAVLSVEANESIDQKIDHDRSTNTEIKSSMSLIFK